MDRCRAIFHRLRSYSNKSHSHDNQLNLRRINETKRLGCTLDISGIIRLLNSHWLLYFQKLENIQLAFCIFAKHCSTNNRHLLCRIDPNLFITKIRGWSNQGFKPYWQNKSEYLKSNNIIRYQLLLLSVQFEEKTKISRFYSIVYSTILENKDIWTLCGIRFHEFFILRSDIYRG